MSFKKDSLVRPLLDYFPNKIKCQCSTYGHKKLCVARLWSVLLGGTTLPHYLTLFRLTVKDRIYFRSLKSPRLNIILFNCARFSELNLCSIFSWFKIQNFSTHWQLSSLRSSVGPPPGGSPPPPPPALEIFLRRKKGLCHTGV